MSPWIGLTVNEQMQLCEEGMRKVAYPKTAFRERPFMAEPGPTLNWRSGLPLIGPLQAEVDPTRLFGPIRS